MADEMRFIYRYALGVVESMDLMKFKPNGPVRQWQEIGWLETLYGWSKLNTDGAAESNPGAAAAGVIIRDQDGNWIYGFKHNIGVGTSMEAGLWGVFS